MRRLTREQQVEQNGERLLDAALRVFLAKGYAGATLEAIADEAGFSKGVVYSQFDGKADLFLALLERRIETRAAQNEQVIARQSPAAALTALLEVAHRLFQQEPGWSLLVVEFRVQAARDRRLRERYARAHERTIAKLSAVLDALHERAGVAPAHPTRTMAEFVLAVGAGIELERINDPAALPFERVANMIAAALGVGAAAAAKSRASRRP